jgi:hypothetical protein
MSYESIRALARRYICPMKGFYSVESAYHLSKESSILEKGLCSNTACGNRSGEFKDYVW